MMKTEHQKAQKKLGETIRNKRKEHGYSQESFAHQCGLHRTYMGAIERGERNISLQNILKISYALNLKACDLFKTADL